MAGFSGILLIIALVLISGLIAYIGDIVGRRMGRKRLSLFGMRPRHTAIAISIVAGMLITIVTLAVAMLVSRDVKAGFLHIGEMRRRQAELSSQLEQVSARMAEVERTREVAEEEVHARRAELDETRAQLSAAQDALAERQEELSNAEATLKRAGDAAIRVAQQNLELGRQRDALERAVEELHARAAKGIFFERETPVIFTAGQPLDWRLFAGGRPTRTTREKLDAFVAELDDRAQAAGARPLPDGETAIIIRKPVLGPDGESVVWVGSDEILDAVAQRIHDTVGGVIVRAYSVYNTHPQEPVRVDFDLLRNYLVFRKDDALAEVTLDGRLPEPALMAALVQLLQEQVGEKARRHNIMPRPDPSGTVGLHSPRDTVGHMSYDELFAVVTRLRGIRGPARVTAIAAANTWTIGPLEVDLMVTPVSSSAPE